ncbi:MULTISPECIES: polyprenyl synthetase family protein [Actinomadura]|uniref:Geranylgeranyl diphosphate synthase, type I n=1 Tax=Actinomadura madurae TaxID=1993 RepID=A0A1I4ZM23_9ACTN|nr:polyprenyl synthetase family protein [Actinomadura madurae]SFN51217.1 geranylgeranyl diphosphate synthase, type I [Actinomadura madurae]SPT63195.1 Farnesyl diphosphate synthase [Actinomadura madurae]
MTTVPVSLTDVRELVDGALRAAVGRLDPRTYRVAAYHLGWTDEEGRPRKEPAGKALRPALALLSARAAVAPPESALPGAVAVELTHAFSLLHDDIMDRDRTRRHRPAAWTVFGEASAILAGDALLALAAEVLLEAPGQGSARAAHALSTATRRLIAGQSLDMDFETRRQIGVDECVAMASGKTAALLACSCAIGAVLDGASEKLCAALQGFGEDLGIAFQLVDDLLGIWGDPEITGKPALSDLRSRKMSLPVVAALNSGTPEAARLSDLYARPDPSEDDLAETAALVEAAGGRAWAEIEAESRIQRAAEHLLDARLPDPVRAEFLHIADFVTCRDH